MPPRSASRMLERRVRSFGFIRVAGVDEVGRGCLAGPVVAAAVVLPDGPRIPGLRDSKLLSAAQRERLFDRLVDAALAWQVASVEPAEIDRINIHQASLRAMRDALLALAPQAGFALVDGFRVPGLPIPQLAIVGGDRRSSAIAAASIVAKVTRDRMMAALHQRDPRYGFDRHKGYATPEHLDAVGRFGYSPVHRRTFRPPSLFDTIDD